MKALDSFGRVGAGYLQGNIFALGSYDECFSLSRTQYCLTDLAMETPGNELALLLYALCLPQACSDEDILTLVDLTNVKFDALNVEIRVNDIRCERETKAPYNAGSIIILLVWSLFAVMVTVATSVHFVTKKLASQKEKISSKIDEKSSKILEVNVEGVRRPKRKKKSLSDTLLSFLLAFSLYETVPKIFAIKNQPASAITCINGIRVISMCWIILGHVNLFSFFFISNGRSYLRNSASRFSYRGVTGVELAVDTFFLMSGLLVTYLILRRMGRRRKVSSFQPSPTTSTGFFGSLRYTLLFCFPTGY